LNLNAGGDPKERSQYPPHILSSIMSTTPDNTKSIFAPVRVRAEHPEQIAKTYPQNYVKNLKKVVDRA
jgi:hypothetical protein